MVLRHSSTLHPHHLLAFAKFASDLRSHSKVKISHLSFKERKNKRAVSKNGLGFSLPAFGSVCFGAPMVK